MKIKLHNNISLKVVNETNLEQLRILRNNPSIQSLLVQSGIITKSEQQRWYREIDKKNNIYFLIFISEELKGYALLKNINSQIQTGEPGIFLIDGKYYDSSIGGLLTISFLDFCNDFFGITYFFGNVLKSNNRALLNYQFFDTSKEHNSNELQLSAKTTYSEMHLINKLRKFIAKTENYTRIFDISSFDQSTTEIPEFSFKENTILIDL